MTRGVIFLMAFVPVVLLSSAAFSDTAPSRSDIIASIWWVPIVAALVGAMSALLTPFVKDLLIQRLNDTWAASNKQREIFRNYAAPLVTSCEKLMWRFSEIFIDSRHQFLKTATLPLVFNDYKRKSTLYRIASLLGWIRAINLELSALPRGASGFLTPVSKAIEEVQGALADGPYVELHRLEQICSVWRIPLDGVSEEDRKTLATRFEIQLYGLAGNSLKDDSDHLKKLDNEQKLAVCLKLSSFLCKELHRTELGEAVVAETVNQAILALSYREALIYRDWQDAIGEAMLEADPDSIRRFRIIGYEKFEEVLAGEAAWMRVFRGSIDDIDFDAIDPNDFRAKQLRDLASGVAGIIMRLAETEEKDLISKPVLDVARKLTS